MIDLLKDSCHIHSRTVTKTGKRSVEEWTRQSAVTKCRKLTRIIHSMNAETSTHATKIMARFMLPKQKTISVRDRIEQGGRMWDVIEVVPAGGYETEYKVAVCEVVA